MKPNYGIDAPGVRLKMLLVGWVGLVLAGLGCLIAMLVPGFTSSAAALIAGVAGLGAAYGLGMGIYMTYSSRVGKLRARERLLDLAGMIAPWTGHEVVLDVGCGSGLMLVGAARRLTTGRAMGIDLWRAEDQASNTPETALENAWREGVAERVSVETGDARNLPYPDAFFDVVLSHWVIHNIWDAADRVRALDEMLRVLRPNGVLVLADIAHFADYRRHFEKFGLSNLHIYTGGLEARIIGALSLGTFRPQALAGYRP